MMCGCRSSDMICASRQNRETAFRFVTRSGRSILTANRPGSRTCDASYTSPIPPWPMRVPNVYVSCKTTPVEPAALPCRGSRTGVCVALGFRVVIRCLQRSRIAFASSRRSRRVRDRDRYAIAPGGLGAIQGVVAGLDQRRDVERALAPRRDADARRQSVAPHEQAAELAAESLRELPRSETDRVGENDGELVAALARDDFELADRARQHLRDQAEGVVARVVSMLVVDALQVIEIDRQDRQRQPMSSGTLELSFEALGITSGVGETGQRIGHRL